MKLFCILCYLFICEISFSQQLHNIQLGTTWIYETEEYPYPIKTSFCRYVVTDTTYIGGNKVYVVENNFDNGKEFMYVDGTKIFFWDTQLEAFQLNYDFSEIVQYQIPWVGLCDSDTGSIIVHVDSISDLVLGSDSIQIQHLSVEGEGSVPSADVYENIGIAYGGLRFPVGIGLCDFNPLITKLRCYENDTVSYSFVNYACDSTWFSTSVKSGQEEIGTIFPNPSDGLIHFKSDELLIKFQLFDLTGMLIEHGLVKDQRLNIPFKGVFILKYYSNHICKSVKILVL